MTDRAVAASRWLLGIPANETLEGIAQQAHRAATTADQSTPTGRRAEVAADLLLAHVNGHRTTKHVAAFLRADFACGKAAVFGSNSTTAGASQLALAL